jgi:hypothetical protein
MEKSFVLIVLSFAALATGGLIVNWIGLGRAMSRLSVSAYIEFHQHTNRTFDPYMPIVVVGALGRRCSPCCDVWCPFHSWTTCRSGCSLLCARNNNWRTHMCPHQPSNCVLVYSESTARMGPNARAMDSVPRHSNSILRSRICRLRSCRDVKDQSITR